MRQFNCERDLNFLSAEQRSKLTEYFRSNRREIKPTILRGMLGVSESESYQIILILTAHRLIRGKYLIYHLQHPDDSYASDRLIEDGLPPLPFYCSICCKNIDTYDELDFQISAD